MDRRFPDPGQPRGGPGQPGIPSQAQQRSAEWTGYPGPAQSYPPDSRQRSGPEWPGYPERYPEREVTLFPESQRRERPPRRPLSRSFLVWFSVGMVLVTTASALVTTLLLRATEPRPANGVSVATAAPTGQPAGPATATPVTPGLPQGALYTQGASSLSRYNLPGGTRAWNITLPTDVVMVAAGDKLFIEDGDVPGGYIAALDAHTGKRLWQSSKYGVGEVLAAGNIVYDGSCSLDMNPCHLYALNAATGALLWSYPLTHGSAWLTVQNGVLYGVSYTDYFALNGTTGALLWHRNLLRYIDQEATMVPVISDNVLSFASCNETKQSRGAPGCDLFTFNTATGAELWHLYTTAKLMSTPAILDGVVYAGSIDGTVFAVNEQNGQQLWTLGTGGTIVQTVAAAGTVYVGIGSSGGQSVQVEAIDAKTHHPLWGQPQTSNGAFLRPPGQPVPLLAPGASQHVPFAPRSGGYAPGVPFQLAGGLLYCLGTSGSDVEVLAGRDDAMLADLSVGSVSSFLAVTQ